MASERNLTERMLSIRDDAFAQLGDNDLADNKVQGNSPTFTVTEAPTDIDRRRENPKIARDVEGTVTVPCYLNTPSCPPAARASTTRPATALPSQLPGQHDRRQLQCIIPRAALDGTGSAARRASRSTATACSASLSEVDGRQRQGDGGRAQHHLLRHRLDRLRRRPTCPTSCSILQDLSHFPTLADQSQQGMLNFLYLGPADDPPERARSERRLPVAAAAAGDRHTRALLRRQQPGRDHRRRADRGRARLPTAPCSACRG